MQRILVFCGSSTGVRAEYADAAVALGRLLAARELGLVYGGASIGLMGVLADAVLAAGGEVTGVITQRLVDAEIPHDGLTEKHVVETMHERKAIMADRADAIIAMPGGIGTLDELFEIFTWSQLGLHDKPIGLLDVAGFWQPMLAMLSAMVEEGFLRAEHLATLVVDVDPERLLDRLGAYEYRSIEKWADGER